MANEIYKNSWWGSPIKDSWGGIYYDFALQQEFRIRVLNDNGIVESVECIIL